MEPNIEDSPSDNSTFPGYFADHRPSHSKVDSVSPRKPIIVQHPIQAKRKPNISSRKATSSDSTDELEDFEPPTQSHQAKQKCLPVRQGIPSKHARQKSPLRTFREESPPNIMKLKVPKPRILFSDDDTTDDMDDDTKPIVIDDNALESVNKPNLQSSKLSKTSTPEYQSQEAHEQDVQQTNVADTTPVKKTLKLSLRRNRSLPKHNREKVFTQTSTLSLLLEQSKPKLQQRSSVNMCTPQVQKASDSSTNVSLDVHAPSQRLSPAEEPPVLNSSSNTLMKSLATTSHQQHSSSVDIIDLSTDDLKEFEKFSDTETGDDIISSLKMKREVRRRFPSSTDADVEPGNESQGCYQSSSKKENSIKKVHKWLDSSVEGNIQVEDVIAQPDSQSDEMMMQSSSLEQPISNPPTSELICDTSDQLSKLAEKLEPVNSSQELKDIEAEQFKDTPQSGRDKYAPESPSSSISSSLPPVMWEQGKLEKDTNVIKISHDQLQSALISASSNEQSSPNTSAINLQCKREQSEGLLLGDRIRDDNEVSKQLDEQNTPEEVRCVENNLREQSMKGIAFVSKEIVADTKGDSEPESMSIGSPMEVDMYQSELSVPEDDATLDQAVNKSESCIDLTVSMLCGHSSSEIHHSGVEESNTPIRSRTNEQLPASTSPAHQTTKQGEGAKPLSRKMPGKSLHAKVPGMTCSNRNAIMRDYLPEPSISMQKSHAKKQSSSTFSLKQSHLKQTEQLSLPQSLPERFRMQSSDASVTIKKSLQTSSATSGKARVEYKGSTSHLSKKAQPSCASLNTSSLTTTLSAPTQNLLASIGQPPPIANELRPKNPPSSLPAKTSNIKHVPLKPRVLPKIDDLSRDVLSWDPAGFLYPQQAEDGKLIEPTIQLKEELVKVPSTEPFQSFDHYLSTFKPLLFHELWSTVSAYPIVL